MTAAAAVSGMGARLYLGVDAGGTYTRSALLDAHGRLLARGAAGAANHHTSDPASARASVREALRNALAAGSDRAPGAVARSAVRAIAIGWSGLEAPGSEAAARSIVGDAVRAEVLVLDSDVVAAHVGAFLGGPGVLVAAGTGSIALGIDEAGRRVRVGGWGHRFGDEGSAAWLATEGIRAALHGVDGRGPATALWGALLSHAGVAAAREPSPERAAVGTSGTGQPPPDAAAVAVTDWLYHPERHLNEIAAFARCIHATAEAGDAVAGDLLRAGGAQLARLVAAVVRRLQPRAPVRVTGTGGVWENAPAVRAACRAATASLLPDLALRWVDPAADPAVGAALMAMRADGAPLPPAATSRPERA